MSRSESSFEYQNVLVDKSENYFLITHSQLEECSPAVNSDNLLYEAKSCVLAQICLVGLLAGLLGKKLTITNIKLHQVIFHAFDVNC